MVNTLDKASTKCINFINLDRDFKVSGEHPELLQLFDDTIILCQF